MVRRVRDHDKRYALGIELAQDAHDLVAMRAVEFFRPAHRPAAGARAAIAGNGHVLLLAARELVRTMTGAAQDAEPRRHLVDPPQGGACFVLSF